MGVQRQLVEKDAALEDLNAMLLAMVQEKDRDMHQAEERLLSTVTGMHRCLTSGCLLPVSICVTLVNLSQIECDLTVGNNDLLCYRHLYLTA